MGKRGGKEKGREDRCGEEERCEGVNIKKWRGKEKKKKKPNCECMLPNIELIIHFSDFS
jgi:hypothetical protein